MFIPKNCNSFTVSTLRPLTKPQLLQRCNREQFPGCQCWVSPLVLQPPNWPKWLLCLLPKWHSVFTKTAPERCFLVTDCRPALSQQPLCCRHLRDIWMWLQTQLSLRSTEQNVLGVKQVVNEYLVQHLGLRQKDWGSRVSFLLVWMAPWYLHCIHKATTTDFGLFLN